MNFRYFRAMTCSWICIQRLNTIERIRINLHLCNSIPSWTIPWLLTAILSLSNHYFAFSHRWRHLMTSQMCFMNKDTNWFYWLVNIIQNQEMYNYCNNYNADIYDTSGVYKCSIGFRAMISVATRRCACLQNHWLWLRLCKYIHI